MKCYKLLIFTSIIAFASQYVMASGCADGTALNMLQTNISIDNQVGNNLSLTYSQENYGGEYVTAPPKTILPGQSGKYLLQHIFGQNAGGIVLYSVDDGFGNKIPVCSFTYNCIPVQVNGDQIYCKIKVANATSQDNAQFKCAVAPVSQPVTEGECTAGNIEFTATSIGASSKRVTK